MAFEGRGDSFRYGRRGRVDDRRRRFVGNESRLEVSLTVTVEVKDPQQHFSLFTQVEAQRNYERDQGLQLQQREQAVAAETRAREEQQRRENVELARKRQELTKEAGVRLEALEKLRKREAQRNFERNQALQHQQLEQAAATEIRASKERQRRVEELEKQNREQAKEAEVLFAALEQSRILEAQRLGKQNKKGQAQNEGSRTYWGEGFHYNNRIVAYKQLVLPRVLRLNFQKIKSIRDIWISAGEFVTALDNKNPTFNFTQEHCEEIWGHCVRSCSRTGEFLVTLGLAPDLSRAQRDIELGAQSIKDTKALRKAIRKRTGNRQADSPATRHQVSAPKTIIACNI